MTSDRDAFPLIDEHTRVLRIINGGVEASPMLTAERFVTMLGIRPAQYRDLAALRGDPSDNLPGVRGIGPKIAAKLLVACGSARAVFEDLAGTGELVRRTVGPALAARLAEPESRAAWELNCQVMTMHDDLALDLDLSAGPGVLPLPAEAVSAVCAAHQLTWTAPAALRALAYQDGAPAPAPVPVRSWTPPTTGGYPGRRFPPLRKREPTGRAAVAANQLALFE
jgi:DNA polymerase-1